MIPYLWIVLDEGRLDLRIGSDEKAKVDVSNLGLLAFMAGLMKT